MIDFNPFVKLTLEFAEACGIDIMAIRTQIGEMIGLRTNHKETIVGAINEVDLKVDVLGGLRLEADQANSRLLLKDGNNTTLSTLDVAFLNNEGTTFNLNETTGRIELLNDQGQVLSSADLQSFIKNMVVNASFHNVEKDKLEFFTADGTVAFKVHYKIENILGLQSSLDTLTNKIGNLPSLTTTYKTDLVGAINEVNGKINPKFQINNPPQGISIVTNLTLNDTYQMVAISVKGNSYGGVIGIDTHIQFYQYQAGSLFDGGLGLTNKLDRFTKAKLYVNTNGNICVWLNKISGFPTISVELINTNSTAEVIGVVDASEPNSNFLNIPITDLWNSSDVNIYQLAQQYHYNFNYLELINQHLHVSANVNFASVNTPTHGDSSMWFQSYQGFLTLGDFVKKDGSSTMSSFLKFNNGWSSGGDAYVTGLYRFYNNGVSKVAFNTNSDVETENFGAASQWFDIVTKGLGNGSTNIAPGNTIKSLRNENGNGGNKHYVPVLHLGAGDTAWQIDVDYGTTTGELRYRSGYGGNYGNWERVTKSWDNATAIGFANGSFSRLPYFYHKTGGFKYIATIEYINAQNYASVTYVNQQIATIPTPNNGQLSFSVSSDFTGGAFSFSANQTANTTASQLQLSTAVKNDITKGVVANGWGNHADAGYVTTAVTGFRSGTNPFQQGLVSLQAGANMTISQNSTTRVWTFSATDTNTITNIGANGVVGTSGNVDFTGTGGTEVVKVGNTLYISQSSLRTTFHNVTATSTLPNTETDKEVQCTNSSPIMLTLPNGHRNGQVIAVHVTTVSGTGGVNFSGQLYYSGANVSTSGSARGTFIFTWNSATSRWWMRGTV